MPSAGARAVLRLPCALLQKHNENQCFGLTQGRERPALLLRRTA